MKTDGRLLQGYSINMNKGAIDLFIGNNALFVNDDKYIFGGYSVGYKTKY